MPRIPAHLRIPVVFRIEARNAAGQQVQPGTRPVHLTVDFHDIPRYQLGYTFVELYSFDEVRGAWQREAAQTDMAAGRIEADLTHFSDWGFGGDEDFKPSPPPNLEGFSVDLCTGYANTTVPLKVPPGINGIQPKLELRYNSGIVDQLNQYFAIDSEIDNGSWTNGPDENGRTILQASPVGLGWTLDLGTIYRSQAKDASGHWSCYLMLGGRTYSLVRVDDTNYRANPDEFQRIRRLTGSTANQGYQNEYWILDSKDGTQYRFGYNADSEQLAAVQQFDFTNGATRVQGAWQWCLDQVQDVNGNTMAVTYVEVQANTTVSGEPAYDQSAYPSVINYTSNANTGLVANRQVTFNYGNRTDTATLAPHGQPVYSQYYWTKYLDSVDMSVAGTRVRRYQFTYEYNPPQWYAKDPTGLQVYPADVLGNGTQSNTPPVAYWRLTEIAGDSDAEDWSGNYLDGTYGSSVARGSSFLPSTNCASFGGDANSYVDCGSPALLDLTGDITLELWFKTAQAPTAGAVLLDKRGTNSGFALIFPTPTTVAGVFGDGTQFVQTLAGTFTADAWTHVVATYSSTDKVAYLWIDGSQSPLPASVQQVADTADVSLRIAQPLNGSGTFTGLIGEVAVYSTVLPGTAITQHYQDGSNPPALTPPPQTQVTGRQKLTLKKVQEWDGTLANALPATQLDYASGPIPGSQTDYFNYQLASASNGYGGMVTFSYERHTPDGWLYLKYRNRVTQQETDAGTGSLNVPGLATPASSSVTRTYTYNSQPAYNLPGTSDYRGHGQVKMQDTAGDTSVSYFYTRDRLTWQRADGNGSVTKSRAEVNVLQSRPYAVEQYAPNAQAPNWTARQETDWSYTVTQGAANFVHADEVRSYLRAQDGTFANSSKKTTTTYETTYGNVTAVQEYGSTTAASGSWLRQKVREFYPGVGNRYIVDHVARELVYASGNPNPVRETQYCYDGASSYTTPISGSGPGRLTAARKVLDDSHCVDVTYGYDAYGHQTSMSEYGGYGTPNGALASSDPRTSTLSFETTYQTYPLVLTNPLNQQTTRHYNPNWGTVSDQTDPNGAVTTYSYDTLGRLTQKQSPAIGGYHKLTSYVYTLAQTLGVAPNARTFNQIQTSVSTDQSGGPSLPTVWQIYDGIGRLIQTLTQTDGSGGVNVANGYYNARGLKHATAVPHFSTTSSTFPASDADWTGDTSPKTETTFDELGRATQVSLPDGQHTSSTYDGWAVESLDQKQHKKRAEKDALGRLVAVKEYTGNNNQGTPAAPWSLYATTTYAYDALDHLTDVWDATAANPGTAPGPVHMVYDELGRKTQMTDTDLGTWTYGYDAVGTLQWQKDARAQSDSSLTTYFGYDALKRLVRTWYTASWTQDTETAGVNKPTVYDLMELRAAVDANRVAANPALSTGGWTDGEIVAGRGVPVRAVHFTELKSRIQDLWNQAALGTIPEFTGGPIQPGTRMIEATDLTDLRGWLQQYETAAPNQRARSYQQYDSTANGNAGIGRRTAVWDASGNQAFTWDTRGRQTQAQITLDGHTYTTSTSYDQLDRPTEVTLPDGEVLTSSYGSNGLLSSLSSSLGDTLVSSVSYNALNLPRNYSLGGSPTAAIQHTWGGVDGAALNGGPYGALGSLVWQQPTTNLNLLNRGFSWDAVGNLTQQVDNAQTPAETLTYTYDDLDRLLSATAATGAVPPLAETYTYDQLGDLTSKNGQAYSYGDSAHQHAVTSVAGGSSYAYDANGSMTARGQQTIRYDPLRHPVRLDSTDPLTQVTTTTARFSYDVDGVRRKRLDANGTIHYLGSYERNIGTGCLPLLNGVVVPNPETITKYYAAQFGALSRVVAVRKSGSLVLGSPQLSYVGCDHLGGPTRWTDPSFNVVDARLNPPSGVLRQMRYTPYGSGRDVLDPGSDHLYTGQVLDQSTGLYWYHTRAYDPALSRFTQPDSLVSQHSAPEAWNRFAYANNNPLRFRDPTGHDPLDQTWRDGMQSTWVHGQHALDWRDEDVELYSLAFPLEFYEQGGFSAFYSSDGTLNDDAFNQIFNNPLPGRNWANMPSALDALRSNYTRLEQGAFVQDVLQLFAGGESRSEGISLRDALQQISNPENVRTHLSLPQQDPTLNWVRWQGHDSDGNVHHWAAFFAAGYALGFDEAVIINAHAEFWTKPHTGMTGNSGPLGPDRDWSDVNLGNIAAAEGATFSDYASLGNLLRADLGSDLQSP